MRRSPRPTRSRAADETPEPAELAAAPDAEPAPAPAAPEPTPVEAPPAPRADVVEQPTWRIVALDPDAQAPGDGAPADAVPPIAATADPQWPTSPEWPSQQGAGLPFLNRPAAASGGIEALWAESAREVATAQVPAGRAAGGVQPCVSCGLSLSATARFCRRCGTSQV